MIEFRIVADDEINKGEVIYLNEESSFDFAPSSNSDIIILFAYLNLGIDSNTMVAQQVWGFSPKESWKQKSINVPNYIKGKIKLVGEYEPGLSWRIDKDRMWQSYFDSTTGWYCIGEYDLEEEYKCIEFSTNTIAVIKNGLLQAILLKPTMK